MVRIEISKLKTRSTSVASPCRDQFEIRNNIKTQILQFSKCVWDFGHLIFGFEMSVFATPYNWANNASYHWDT